MFFRIIFLLFAFQSVAYAGNPVNVVGLDVMTSIYQQTINVGTTKNPPMPKLYVYDSQQQAFLSKQETFRLLNVKGAIEDKSLISFVGNTSEQNIAVDSPEIITKQLKAADKRFIAIYFNMPSDSLEAILDFMPDFVEKQTKVLANLNEHKNLGLYKTFL